MKLHHVTKFFAGAALLATSVTAQIAPMEEAPPPSPQAQRPNMPVAPEPSKVEQDAAPLMKKFLDVLQVVEANSADPVSPDQLIYKGAIPSMLQQLDPHTQFFDPDQFDQLKQMESSEQKGFGSVVSVLPGRVLFLQTLPGTPTNKAGIMPGDELVAVNNVPIGSLEPEQIIQLLTQARQQQVKVYIRRQGFSHILDFNLTPALVDAPSVDRAYLLATGIAYVRLANWDLETGRLFHDAIEKLGGKNLKGLVVDLRNNPGGVMKAALDGASMFLKPGQRILTARSRYGESESADVTPNAIPYNFPVAVLINERTASASEIFAGAMQDHDRATIVGLTSFGKGLVQSVMPLSSNTGIALTTAFYYTPSGRSIQHPLANSALEKTFRNDPNVKAPTYRTDGGRTVTGGGGIQPDLQVGPVSPTRLEAVMDASGSVIQFATQYLSTHRSIPDKFEVPPEMLDEFKVFLSARNIQPSIGEWTTERNWITSRLKQEVLTQAKGIAQGDEVEASRDPQVTAAVQSLRKPLLARN